jgi:hypothetical protein
MARRPRSSQIENRTNRLKLKPRRKPYYAAQWRNSIGQCYRATLTIGKLNFRVVVG